METKEKHDKEFETKIRDEVSRKLESLQLEEKSMLNRDGDDKLKQKYEFKELANGQIEYEVPLRDQWKEAADLHNKSGLGIKASTFDVFERTAKGDYNIEIKGRLGNMIECKALGLGTNTTAYGQSVAELSDIYDPVINNTLNQRTSLFNFLPKDDFSNKGNNQVQFTVKDVANTTAAAYTGNAVSTGNAGREKNQTKFKKYQCGIEVDGDMIAAARGGQPLGDVFAKEVEDATIDMVSVVNQALFAEAGTEASAGIIGLPYITDAAGNTALYGQTRSTKGYMDGNGGATYINASSNDISLALLRQAIRQSTSDAGSAQEDLMFVCDWVQYHKFLAIYDNAQRLVPTSSRFGFEGKAELDGVPILVDKDCKSGSWFLIDLRWGYRIAMWVPPTLEMLGKDSDAQKGFVKTYLATYSRNPNSVVEVYGAATS